MAARLQQKTPAELFLWLLLDPARPVLIGEIKQMVNGDCSLSYDDQWITNGFALSPDLPLIQGVYAPVHHHARESGAPGVADDARPDRWGEKVIRYLHKPAAMVYDLLYFAGHERFGALGSSTSKAAYIPFGGCSMARLQDVQELSEAVHIIESGLGELAEQQAFLANAAGALGGAKPKAAISIHGNEYVIKFFNGEPTDQPLVEHATMSLARAAGLDVAETHLVRLATEHALAVERFDRVDGKRVHCISACTLLRSITPGGEDPEFGYPQLARGLKLFANVNTLDTQLRELFRRMVFNILVANTDDHEKNHSLVCTITGRTMRMDLSKAYDIVPTGSGATEHEFYISETSKEPCLEEAMRSCRVFNLEPADAASEVAKLIAVVNDWKPFFSNLGVTPGDISELEELIDSDTLMAQRSGFDPSIYVDVKEPRAKKSGAKAFRP